MTVVGDKRRGGKEGVGGNFDIFHSMLSISEPNCPFMMNFGILNSHQFSATVKLLFFNSSSSLVQVSRLFPEEVLRDQITSLNSLQLDYTNS